MNHHTQTTENQFYNLQAIRRSATVLLVACSALLFSACSEVVHIERSIEINASVEEVWPYLSDVTRGREWDPWAKADPTMETTYGEITSGEGASYGWTSENSGEGTAIVTKYIENERLEMALDFGDMGTGNAFLQVDEAGEGVNVTWGFDSEVPFFVVSMVETDVGSKYEEGLAMLKELVESR